MSSITESVDVDVPVPTAYSQWTQFESFPVFHRMGAGRARATAQLEIDPEGVRGERR